MEKLSSNHIYELNLVMEDLEHVDSETIKKRVTFYKVLKVLGVVITYALLVFALFIALLPFYWMIITSLKSYEEAVSTPPTFFPTEGIYFSNFSEVFTYFDFTRYVGNTLIVIVISTIGTVLTTILAAFAFARLEFKGRDTLFVVFLATMMIPSELFVITNYITVYRYGLLDSDRTAIQSYLAIMLPFIVNVFYIYLLRQNFKQIPNELYLAAKVDGKTDLEYLFKVMVPIASPTIVTITILKIISTWNAYAWPNAVASSTTDPYTIISVALENTQFVDSAGMRELVNIEMAAAVLVTLPLILLFIIFRKYIMKGASKAGIKG